MNYSEKLKSCPFCGGEAGLIVANAFPDVNWIRCNRCGIETSAFATGLEAIKAWNQRATPIPDTPEMVRALDDAYEAGRKSAERTCKDKAEAAKIDGFLCSECGCCLDGEQFYCGELKFCPNCGAKVVE